MNFKLAHFRGFINIWRTSTIYNAYVRCIPVNNGNLRFYERSDDLGSLNSFKQSKFSVIFSGMSAVECEDFQIQGLLQNQLEKLPISLNN